MPATVSQRQLMASIHDVTPATLGQTEAIHGELHDGGIDKVTLLVVPDTGWNNSTLTRLRTLVDTGAELAGHGWRHKVERVRGLKHRLHSLTISRDVAEHLALDEAGIARLLERCYQWFAENHLPSPELYVPPAWAMGAISQARLTAAPFRYFETFTGNYDSQRHRFFPSAMVGFEADSMLRCLAARCWNALNLLIAGNRHPIRLAIHPDDRSLRLASQLRRLVNEGGQSFFYREMLNERSLSPS